MIYLESVTGSDKVNDYILKNVSFLSALPKKKLKDLKSLIPAPNTKVLKSPDEIEFYITNGFTIVIRGKEILALETRADIARGIPEPTTEQVIFGPKDAFTENIQINLGLLKRRLKSKNLKAKSTVIGRKSKTMVEVLYFDDIAEDDLVAHVLEKLDKIDIDGILDSGNVVEFLSKENKSHFPIIMKTERPDTAAKALLEGKVVLFIDTSPFALILPGFFADFINPISDNYKKSNNINFLKILRFFCFFLYLRQAVIPIRRQRRFCSARNIRPPIVRQPIRSCGKQKNFPSWMQNISHSSTIRTILPLIMRSMPQECVTIRRSAPMRRSTSPTKDTVLRRGTSPATSGVLSAETFWSGVSTPSVRTRFRPEPWWISTGFRTPTATSTFPD